MPCVGSLWRWAARRWAKLLLGAVCLLRFGSGVEACQGVICRLHREQLLERRRGAAAKRPRAAPGVAATSAAAAGTAPVCAGRALGRMLSRTEVDAPNAAGANPLLKAEMPSPNGQGASQSKTPTPEAAAAESKSSKPGVLTGAARLKGSDSARCAVIRNIAN